MLDEKRATVRRALGRLPADYSQALYLVYFEDMSAAEAGEVMKKNRKQTENLIYRAKLALRNELGKEGLSYEDL